MKRRSSPHLTMYHEEYEAVRERLYAYQQAGVALTLAGRPSSPGYLAYVSVVREHGRYMTDYIPDEDGKLCEIRFDKVE